MKNIKNKIIAISGEPVSGKSTAIKNIVENLKSKKYKEENIHIISTGNAFRDYFDKIIFLIKSINDEKIVKQIAEDEKIKLILKNPEYRKILERTIVNIQKNNIDLDEYKKISKTNNSEVFMELRKVIDSLIDTNTKNIGKMINEEERPNDIWIFDSRMAFSLIPDAFAVRLTTMPREAARRLYNDETRGAEDKYTSIEEAEKEREERRRGEIERYKHKYNVDLENAENYDLIIDTSYADPSEIANTILICEEKYRNNEPYAKTWASPLTMIPCQTLGETWEPQMWSNWSLEELTESIKNNGYYPDAEIEIYKIDGINYINDGHHANFASIRAGKTLIPYRDLMQTKEGKERYESGSCPTSRKNYLYDHEDMVEKALRRNSGDYSKKFSYSDIYPDIIEKIEHGDKER